MKVTRRTALQASLAAGLGATALAGCGGGGSASGKTEITVATFNEFGYEDLYATYMAENPDVVIKAKKAATSDEARQNLLTGLAAKSGLADIEAIEVNWWAELKQYATVFEDLASPEVEGRWLDWKTEAAMIDGKLLGYGTDIGPEAIAYRADLFTTGGLPADRGDVKALLEGDWRTFLEVGRSFTQASGIPFYDSAGGTFNGMMQQLAHPYEEEDGTPIPLGDNAPIKEIYDLLVEYKDISAGLGQWSEDWVAAFQTDGFATMLCPAWMMGPIQGNADGVDGWDIADVFPGGGGNWGGSYLTVPSQGKNVEAAKKLAAWLTAPEQQLAAFTAVGAFPSQVEALDSPEVTSVMVPFFNDAPVGQIYSERAKAITTQPALGPNFFTINGFVADAITRFDVEGMDPEKSWQEALTAYKELGL